MSSVPYTGSIANNLTTSALLGAFSAFSALAWWDREPAAGQQPNLIQSGFTVSDNAPGAVAVASIATGALAADMFVRGVAAPLYEKAKAAGASAVSWVMSYRCRADGAAALAATAAGMAIVGTSAATDSTFGMIVGFMPTIAGPLYLNSSYGNGAISQPPAAGLPKSLASIAPVSTVEITPEHPLHVDAPYRIKYLTNDQIVFTSAGAAFVGRMMKQEYMKSANADFFLEQPGEKLREAFVNLGANEVADGFLLNHADAYNNYSRLMSDTLYLKFGIKQSKLTAEQKKLREELKKTCGNLKHPEIRAGGQVLISDLRMTSMFKNLYDAIVEEDRKASEPSVYSSSGGSSLGGGSRASSLWRPTGRSLDDGF